VVGAPADRADRGRPATAVRPAGVRLRLTRRARRLAVVLALAAGVALGSWLGPLLSGGGGDLHLAGVQSVVVQPGDTLWSIATSLNGDGDVRSVIDEIQQLNGLNSAVLVPGQTLLLP
jgi:nucleoid-associated protein YgaU